MWIVDCSGFNDKGTCREIDNVYQATCDNAVIMRGDSGPQWLQ